MKIYAAYGSNLNIKQMLERCPNSYPIGACYLQDWQLVFKGVADLEKKIGALSFIGLYEISKSCEASLDKYEEYPHVYKKNKIKKKIEGKNRDIMFYTMQKKYQYSVPTIKYYKVIEKGFKNWNGSIKLLKDSCIHSINHHTTKGYKSENWKDKEYIKFDYLKNRLS
tara:strand:+ start:332 stop:832 length:501 start_codon:yes stop_codon:yes gene_type:complete